VQQSTTSGEISTPPPLPVPIVTACIFKGP
jgi:hypothetical protein